MKLKISIVSATIAQFIALSALPALAADPLPSWNEGKTKSAIIHFVEQVTKEDSPDFVPKAERIATFDNDGTLILEMPLYIQLKFTLDQLKTLAASHPEWKDTEPFKSALAGDLNAVLGNGAKLLPQLLLTAHSDMSTQEFEKIVEKWFASARDDRFKSPYPGLVYQPMLELLDYLRSNGFKTYIVSGGGLEFMRSYCEKSYGIPPEQIIGSSTKTKLELHDGKLAIMRLPAIEYIDDRDEKPINIQKIIGRRPIAAFGNSDGDLQMLQWVDAGPAKHFCLYVHHTDAAREYAYDRDSKIGRLDKGLDEAEKRAWTVVDMKNDWNKIFPADLK